MESRWYLLPGQTLENTKISDRGHALHVTQTEWNKITDHLTRKQKIAEAIEEEKAHKRALKEESDAMTKNWLDSIEHVHMHKQEERRKQAEERERLRTENYNELRKEQAQIKDEFLRKVKRSIFYEKAYPKGLNGALTLSEALYEREKQKEFRKILRQHDIEEEEKYAESIKKGAEDEKREKQEKAEEVRKKKLELKELYLREIREKEEASKKKIEKRRKQELIDNENARLEIELEEQIKLEDAMIIKAERKRELEEYLTGSNEYKRMLKKEDDEVDEVIQIFDKAKNRIDCLKKEKMEEIRRQQVARRDAASLKVIAEAKAKDEAFEHSIKVAQEEADAREEAKEQERIERRNQLRKDREEDRINYLERKAEEDRTVFEGKKWDMLNRLKCDETIKEYNVVKMKEKWDKTMKYRQELLEQMADNKKQWVDDSEQKIVDEYVMKKIKEADDEFFEYADMLIDYAKKNNRPLYPIMQVVTDYKIHNKLMDKKSPGYMCKMPDGTIMNGDVKMVNVTPGKMAHDPRADPSYQKCRCHKDWMIQ